ncbi:hypothetical protein DUNSADRAFT_4356 [Dunaliella salina]|uniref:PPM-type phosphatase domain-containing protein n=1 Tax=Dunaliella salina TaxID=3046 RepID=A0ABQ7H7R1_DUNSA|nr:hypothetical protein DUNSADRAFT_4356 [Dunaliella salina]|eukprot:KAF5842897.1 hypothetical protein DUNSADRAFT_4356 [Dunaliella salina]
MGSSFSACLGDGGKHVSQSKPRANGLEAAPKQQVQDQLEKEAGLNGVQRAPSVKSGTPGARLSLPPVDDVHFAAIDASLLSALSGPDGGVQVIRSCAPDLKLPWPWNKGSSWAYGSSISLYDATITAGKPTRSGDPIADCFAIISFKGGALLMVADGVNWGEPARRAARCAVLGATQHLCAMMQEKVCKEPGPTSSAVFHEMLAAVKAAHTLILQQCGTLTTLVLTLVLRVQDG